MYVLERLEGDEVVSRHPIRARPLYVGRGPTNELVLLDSTVSTRHLTVWADDEGCWVEDLRSRNGTRRAGAPLEGAALLEVGDILELGERTRLRLARQNEPLALTAQLEDLDRGARHTFTADRFVIGGSPTADVVVPDTTSVTLLVHANGEVWLGRDGRSDELAPDTPFAVGARRFCLRRGPSDLMLGRTFACTRYPYTLQARLDGPTGPEATLRDVRTGAAHTVVADTRALLLYVLGRRMYDEREAGVPAADAGWCPDDEIAQGIWGRSLGIQQVHQLNVLVWRLRRELEGAAFDPWCVEKRRRHMRVRVETVSFA